MSSPAGGAGASISCKVHQRLESPYAVAFAKISEADWGSKKAVDLYQGLHRDLASRDLSKDSYLRFSRKRNSTPCSITYFPASKELFVRQAKDWKEGCFKIIRKCIRIDSDGKDHLEVDIRQRKEYRGRKGDVFQMEQQEKFHNEFELLRALPSHPNIVPTAHRVLKREDGKESYLQKLYPNTLEERINDLSPKEFLRISLQLLDALDHLCAHRIAHCDFHVAQVLLDGDDRPFITDFGDARKCKIDLIGAPEMDLDFLNSHPSIRAMNLDLSDVSSSNDLRKVIEEILGK